MVEQDGTTVDPATPTVKMFGVHRSGQPNVEFNRLFYLMEERSKKFPYYKWPLFEFVVDPSTNETVLSWGNSPRHPVKTSRYSATRLTPSGMKTDTFSLYEINWDVKVRVVEEVDLLIKELGIEFPSFARGLTKLRMGVWPNFFRWIVDLYFGIKVPQFRREGEILDDPESCIKENLSIVSDMVIKAIDVDRRRIVFTIDNASQGQMTRISQVFRDFDYTVKFTTY